jgi:hypothetical protein
MLGGVAINQVGINYRTWLGSVKFGFSGLELVGQKTL